MDLKNETDLGIGLVRNEDYVGLYFNLTAWNIKKPSNVIQLSLRKGSWINISLISYCQITLSDQAISKPFQSKRNEEGHVHAGTHLIIMGDSSCRETIDKSDPAILNYYRQFLIKGFDWHINSRGARIFSLFILCFYFYSLLSSDER